MSKQKSILLMILAISILVIDIAFILDDLDGIEKTGVMIIGIGMVMFLRGIDAYHENKKKT